MYQSQGKSFRGQKPKTTPTERREDGLNRPSKRICLTNEKTQIQLLLLILLLLGMILSTVAASVQGNPAFSWWKPTCHDANSRICKFSPNVQFCNPTKIIEENILPLDALNLQLDSQSLDPLSDGIHPFDRLTDHLSALMLDSEWVATNAYGTIHALRWELTTLEVIVQPDILISKNEIPKKVKQWHEKRRIVIDETWKFKSSQNGFLQKVDASTLSFFEDRPQVTWNSDYFRLLRTLIYWIPNLNHRVATNVRVLSNNLRGELTNIFQPRALALFHSLGSVEEIRTAIHKLVTEDVVGLEEQVCKKPWSSIVLDPMGIAFREHRRQLERFYDYLSFDEQSAINDTALTLRVQKTILHMDALVRDLQMVETGGAFQDIGYLKRVMGGIKDVIDMIDSNRLERAMVDNLE
ncbi:hypothetical protein MMC14_006252 [Varicellaria rhodocarpa]|nr:hypothetical protein [Varicellaria rhodocarpa]